MTSTTSPPIDTQLTLGALVAERPARARVLEQAGIDYCCHGHRTLDDAAVDAGLDPAVLAAALAAVDDETGMDVDGLDPVALVDHIVATHHAYLHEELPLLDALATKVRDVHAERHAELVEVAALVQELRHDLEPHLAVEEDVLFPAIRAGLPDPEALAATVRSLAAEHDRAGELLAALRRLTSDHEVPADGCASYRSLYERLARLEVDTHRHVHLENNVLFTALTG